MEPVTVYTIHEETECVACPATDIYRYNLPDAAVKAYVKATSEVVSRLEPTVTRFVVRELRECHSDMRGNVTERRHFIAVHPELERLLYPALTGEISDLKAENSRLNGDYRVALGVNKKLAENIKALTRAIEDFESLPLWRRLWVAVVGINTVKPSGVE